MRRAAPDVAVDPLWYRDAVFYEIRVGAFQDSDGDGLGDFRGLTSRLDYLRDLGVTALWLLPFYPSPWRDDGYDIADYQQVHPDAGTLDDFRELLDEAHRRDLRIVTELVMNHTSDEHAWFQRARQASPGSRWRDFYVWSDSPDRYAEARIIFKDFERSNWTWDPVAKAYYWHRFYSHQPDLNFDNPAVRRAVLKVLDFWLDLGVDGLRLDAIPYLVEREGTNCENLPETHRILKELRRHVDRRYGSRMLLAEANQWPEDAIAYFGDGDECHMAFHFPVMPRLFMALRMEDRFPIVDILAQTPPIPDGCQWALFLRNHDELTLEMVTDEERDYMYRVYARDARARLNLGIRRRLAPLLGNDRRRIELMNALLFSLPGTPVVYYGDEIGMGDNIYLGDRNGVRTPMQWSADRNAGFSRSNPQRLHLPVVVDPEFHYERVNVEAQQGNEHSLLRWMRRMIALRRRHPAFSRGTLELLGPSNAKVLAFLRRHEGDELLVVANLSRFVQFVELDLAAFEGATLRELFSRNAFPRVGSGKYILTLGPHAFYWFAVERQGAAAAAPASGPPVLECTEAPTSFLGAAPRPECERALAEAVARQRWYAGKASPIAALTIVEAFPIGGGAAGEVVIARIRPAEGEAVLYAVPLAIRMGDDAAHARQRPESVLIELRVEGSDATGVCVDGPGDPAFVTGLLDAIGRRRRIRGAEGTLVASTTARFRELRGGEDDALPPAAIHGDHSNTSIRFGDRLMLKVLRRLPDGTSPEIEVGRHLAERRQFPNVAPVAGAIEYVRPQEEPVSVAVLQGFVPNEGNAWRWALDHLATYVEHVLGAVERGEAAPAVPSGWIARSEAEPPPVVADAMGTFLEATHLLGRRIAEMHLCLATDGDDRAFTPEPFGQLYQRALYQSVRTVVGRLFRRLRAGTAGLAPEDAAAIARLVGSEAQVIEACRALVGPALSGRRIRVHGDLHLGQVLRSGGDFLVIDFEGEPARSLGERRLKRSPLGDVAGMLRSFEYAAHTALRHARERGIVRSTDAPRIEPWTAAWTGYAGGAFFRSYVTQLAGSGLLPKTARELEVLLRVLLVEKNVYEIGYELEYRPDWIGIPVHGLLAIIDEARPHGG